MYKKKTLWIVLGALGSLGALCFACYMYLFGPSYIPTPDFGFHSVIEQSTSRYRVGDDRTEPTFDVEEAKYILADSSFDTDDKLDQYLDAQISQAGWTDNDTLSQPISLFCNRVIPPDFNSQQASIKAYVDNRAVGAINRWAAPHLCVITKHHIEEHYYEVIVATLDPTLISALSD